MLAGPLPGIYDPTAPGPGRMLFAFFAAMAETERGNIREATLEGLDAAARQGRTGGRPAVITDDMLHTVLRRRAAGESVEQIRPDLIIPTGRRKGHNPGLASIYRALADHHKAQTYPEAVDQAHAEHSAAHSTPGTTGPVPRPRPARVFDPVDPELRERLQAQPHPNLTHAEDPSPSANLRTRTRSARPGRPPRLKLVPEPDVGSQIANVHPPELE